MCHSRSISSQIFQAGTGAVPFGDPVPVGTNEVTVIDAGATSCHVSSCHVSSCHVSSCHVSSCLVTVCATAPGPGSGVYIDANYHVAWSSGKRTAQQLL